MCFTVWLERKSGKKEMVDDGVVVAVLMSRKGGGHHQNEVVRQTQISRHKLMQGKPTQSILKTITWVRLKGEHHVLLFSNDHRLINLLSIIFKIELCFLSGPNLTTKLASSTIEERGKWIIMIFMLNGISLLLFETTLSMMKYPHPVFWKIETINSV